TSGVMKACSMPAPSILTSGGCASSWARPATPSKLSAVSVIVCAKARSRMLWWIVGIGLLVVVAAAFYLQRLWLRPWQELEHLLTRIGRGEQPRTFLLSGTAQTRRAGLALEQLLIRQRELDRRVSKDAVY